jgi:hypothetical protein
VDGNKVVSWGFNKAFRTHPLALKFQHRFADIHSELAAIASFPYRIKELRNYEIVNVRVKRIDNLFGYAMPCIYCIPMLQSFGFTKVTFSDGDGLWNVRAL